LITKVKLEGQENKVVLKLIEYFFITFDVNRNFPYRKMKIAITGSNGLIGRRLQKEFAIRGWEVIAINRQDQYEGGEKLISRLSGTNVVIHLSGAPIIHRWTKKYNVEMFDSRVKTTANVAQSIASMQDPPGVFISTSAVGIYSEHGVHTEENAVLANDFLGRLCQQWETATQAAQQKTRLAIFRLGIVLDKNGGALKKMMLPFKFRLGGPVGNGKQMVSWVHIDDLVAAVLFTIEHEISGTFNLCAPEAVSNTEFSKALAKTMHRISWLKVPIFALKILYGEGSCVLTSGQNAVPERLLKAGFEFQFPSITDALNDLLK
jgi:hypothetical protein